MAKIILRHNNKTLGEYGLESGMNSIGRLPGHFITVENLGVSRSHAFILGDITKTIWVLEDLGSLNGTFVNKKRIKKHLLKQNDVITIGQHSLEFMNSESGLLPSLKPAQNHSVGLPQAGHEPWLENKEGRKFPLYKQILYFGNSSSDDISIPGLMVGKNFASISNVENRWSINLLVKRFAQIELNGEEIESAELKNGDEIKVAGEIFKFKTLNFFSFLAASSNP